MFKTPISWKRMVTFLKTLLTLLPFIISIEEPGTFNWECDGLHFIDFLYMVSINTFLFCVSCKFAVGFRDLVRLMLDTIAK